MTFWFVPKIELESILVLYPTEKDRKGGKLGVGGNEKLAESVLCDRIIQLRFYVYHINWCLCLPYFRNSFFLLLEKQKINSYTVCQLP